MQQEMILACQNPVSWLFGTSGRSSYLMACKNPITYKITQKKKHGNVAIVLNSSTNNSVVLEINLEIVRKGYFSQVLSESIETSIEKLENITSLIQKKQSVTHKKLILIEKFSHEKKTGLKL